MLHVQMYKFLVSFFFLLLLGEPSLYGLNNQSVHDVELTPAQICTESLQLQMDFNHSTHSRTTAFSLLLLLLLLLLFIHVIMQHRSQNNLSQIDRETDLLEEKSQKIVDDSLKHPTVQQNRQRKKKKINK